MHMHIHAHTPSETCFFPLKFIFLQFSHVNNSSSSPFPCCILFHQINIHYLSILQLIEIDVDSKFSLKTY